MFENKRANHMKMIRRWEEFRDRREVGIREYVLAREMQIRKVKWM